MMRHLQQRNNSSTPVRCVLTVVFLLLFPGLLLAHPADAGPVSGFLSGLNHPFGGVDHILPMIAVGLWAVLSDGKAFWRLPVVFIGGMAAGSVLGMSGGALPFVEEGILVSVLLLGGFLAGTPRLSVSSGVALIALCGLFHGNVHGVEVAAGTSAVEYMVGFTGATIVLHATGLGFGFIARSNRGKRLIRFSGVAMVAAGLVMWLM